MADEANKHQAQGEQQKPQEKLNDHNSGTGKSLPILPLLLGLEEKSREAYIEQYGRHNLLGDPVTAVSERIGKATVNLSVLCPERLKAGCRFFIEVFDQKSYIVALNKSNSYQDSLSARGKVENFSLSVFVISSTAQQVSAILRLAELNTIYLLKCNSPSAEHYLFKTRIDLIKLPEEVKIPVRPDK